MRSFADILAEIEGFQWDAGNQSKSMLKHKVSTREAEEVFFNSPLILFSDTKHSEFEERLACWGHTDEGRRLSLSFVVRGRKIRVITVRPMSRKERREYEKEA